MSAGSNQNKFQKVESSLQCGGEGGGVGME